MLYQLHWQWPDKTEMRAQEEFFACNDNANAMREWTKDVNNRHPLPDGARWFMCTEENKHFVWMPDTLHNRELFGTAKAITK